MDSSAVIAGRGGIRGLNDNGKNTIKIKNNKEKKKMLQEKLHNRHI